jgi:hypothetical protein
MNVFVVSTGDEGSTGEYPHAVRNHYALGAVGLGITMVSVFLAYSVLVDVANLVPLLSTTLIVFVGVVMWVVAWLTLDVVHEQVVRRRYLD